VKITSAEAGCYRVPLKDPWESAAHTITHLELVITRVRTDTEHEGVGWSYTIGAGGTAAAAFLADDLLPRLAGQDPSAVERIWRDLWTRARDAGAGGIALLGVASADIALWDLKARAAGQPLYRLLGACRDRVEAYGSGVNLNKTLPQLLEQVRRWQARGYRAFKIKVGLDDPREDAERVGAVRELIGPRAALMVDANQKWTAAEAVRRIPLLEPFAPWWVEEPLLADDVPGHAWVRAHTRPPVAIGENVFTAYQFNAYLRAAAADVVQPDVARVGGITEWMKVAHLAHAYNVPVSPHLMLEISGHLACAVPNASLLEDVDGGSLAELGVLEEPIRVQEGFFAPPPHPGHGVRFDWDALARWAVAPDRRRPGR
jgi:L-alanine-DL-glutamate epimerase-like enolase superfamily enzyme